HHWKAPELVLRTGGGRHLQNPGRSKQLPAATGERHWTHPLQGPRRGWRNQRNLRSHLDRRQGSGSHGGIELWSALQAVRRDYFYAGCVWQRRLQFLEGAERLLEHWGAERPQPSFPNPERLESAQPQFGYSGHVPARRQRGEALVHLFH